jgi:cation diffusion facilitator family transporter
MAPRENGSHCYDHGFGQHLTRPGERRTRIVVAITVLTMVVEIVAGIAFGSMALLADGLHMGSHAVALGLAAVAYAYARRHAFDRRYSFGTGKVNALAGFAGALLLVGFAVFMVVESVERFLNPVEIRYGYAIAVAVVGLIVNGLSVVILGAHGHDVAHGHAHDHEHGHGHGQDHAHDHNLRSAYLHVMADALTSVTAIVALLAGHYFGFAWLDPVMGVVGAVLVTHWSIGLLRQTASVLLDRQCPPETEEAMRTAIESDGATRVVDLHVWSIGPGIFAAVIGVIGPAGLQPDAVKDRLPRDLGLVHVTVEVRAVSVVEGHARA